MIKPLNYEDTPFKEPKKIFEMFGEDIRNIISNGIEYCEIEDMPYKHSVSVQDLAYRARKSLRIYFWETYGVGPESTDFFTFKKKRNGNKYQFFCKFDKAGYDKMTEKVLRHGTND